MGLLSLSNKERINRVKFTDISIEIRGRTKTLEKIPERPSYIHEGWNDQGFDHCWGIMYIMSRLKEYGEDILIIPERLKEFVINELGTKKVKTKSPDKNWMILYGDVHETRGEKWFTVGISGPGDTVYVKFEIFFEHDDALIEYIEGLKNEPITNYQ